MDDPDRAAEPRTFTLPDDDVHLDVCDATQVQAWADFYGTTPDVIRDTCKEVGTNHRTAVELKLSAPRA